MKKLAILLPKIDQSQLSLLMVKNINKLSELNPDISPVVFHNDWGFVGLVPLFCMLQIREIWGFDGVAISTNLDTTQRLLATPTTSKKFFYVWDLEWLTLQINYKALANIYLNPEIELIARSQSHANIISKVWRAPAHVLEDFNHEQLKQII